MNKIIITIFLFSEVVFSQNLDSLYQRLVSISSKSSKNFFSTSSLDDKVTDKCGFGLSATIKEHFNEFTTEQQLNIQNILARPELNSSIISPSGIFKIHFDNFGDNKPVYNIEDLAVAFDSAYNYEVNFIGYPPPPSDGGLGGDTKYDVYVINLSGGLYGATTPESTIGGGKYLSYIEIDNSFSKSEGYNTFGIDAARATAAHEFHHAIQLGNYTFRSEDTYYYELTSTAFEEFVYDEVNDYYSYMNSFFRSTANKFSNNSGYNLAVWNIFLVEKFKDENPMLGHNIIKKSWEYIVDNRAIIAIAKAMSDFNKSFSNEFNVFGDWLFFTGSRAKNNMYFEEAKNYPLVRYNYTIELDNTDKTLSFFSEPTSINYIRYLDYTQGFSDTLVAVISNSDVNGSLKDGNSLNLDFTLSINNFEGSSPINNIYYSKLSSQSIENLQTSFIINNELAPSDINRSEIDFAYPQPFTYADGFISIPTYPDLSNKAELNIYSTDMDLIFSDNLPIFSSDNIVVKWDGLDSKGKRVASGVYVFITRANGKIKKGKLAILN